MKVHIEIRAYFNKEEEKQKVIILGGYFLTVKCLKMISQTDG